MSDCSLARLHARRERGFGFNYILCSPYLVERGDMGGGKNSVDFVHGYLYIFFDLIYLPTYTNMLMSRVSDG